MDLATALATSIAITLHLGSYTYMARDTDPCAVYVERANIYDLDECTSIERVGESRDDVPCHCADLYDASGRAFNADFCFVEGD